MYRDIRPVPSILCLLLVAGVRADLKPFSPDSHGRWPKPAWLTGQWKDKTQDAVYRTMRSDIERLPTRTKSVKLVDVEAAINSASRAMTTKPNWQNLYRLTYLTARYPVTAREQAYLIQKYLFQYSSPDSREYARAAFCALAMADMSGQIPRSIADRLKAHSEDDVILQEALVKYYIASRDRALEDRKWALAAARKRYDSHPEGRYVYGNRLISAISSYAYASSTIAAMERGIADIAEVIRDGYLDKQSVAIARSTIERMKKANDIAPKEGRQRGRQMRC